LDNAKQRMIKIRASREDGKKGRVWTMMLAFARAQNDSAERALSNKEIDKLFEQKIAEDREKVDILWGARNSMLKANEGVEDRKIQDAIDLCDQRIAEMGGTRKQRKAAEKAAERAAKIAKGEKVAPVRKVKRK
jgi:topoisomerase IA-like protein